MPVVAAFFAALTFTAVATQIAIAIVTNIIVGAITRALTKKPKQFAPPINVTVRNSSENRRICFGTRRIGGSFVYINTSSSNGSKADLLWYVICFTGHEISQFDNIYLDNQIISGTIDPTTGVVSGSSRFDGKLKIWFFTGTSSQAVLPQLDSAFTEITSDFRLRGCAYVVLQMTRDDVAFFSGPPQNITAIVDGLKYYDSRQDSTNGGTGSCRKTNPSTWLFGRNPVWQIRWYLTGGSVHNTGETTRLIKYGLNESDERIDDATFLAAANICDELLTGAVAPPSGTDTRYTSELEASTGETHRAILQELLDSMAGTLVYVHGKWRLYAGAYDVPAHSFTQEDLYGELQVSDTTDGDDRYNAVAGVFVDAQAGFAETTSMFRTDSAYEAQDGGERLIREIDLRAVTRRTQVDRLAEIQLRNSRMMRTIVMTGALNLMKVSVNETFTLSHARYGWTNRVFRCLEKQFQFGDEAGKVVLTARAESSAVYADILTADYISGTSSTDEFKTELPDPPTSLTAETQVTAVKLAVGLPSSFPPGAIVQIFEHTSSTPFSSATLISQQRSSLFIVQRRDETTRFYWARIKAQDGGLSDTFPASTGASGVASFVQTADIADLAATEIIEQTITSGNQTVFSGATAGFYQIAPGIRSFDFKGVFTFTADLVRGAAASLDAYPVLLDAPGGSVVSTGQDCLITTTLERITLQMTASITAGSNSSFNINVDNLGAATETLTYTNLTGRLELIKK